MNNAFSPGDPRWVTFEFVDAAWGMQSLELAWRFAAQDFRLCAAQSFLHAHEAQALHKGYNLDESALSLASSDTSHGLWRDFQAWTINPLGMQGDLADQDLWGYSATSRDEGTDLGLVYVYDKAGTNPDGTIPPGPPPRRIAFLMVKEAARWKVLNVNSLIIPQPGWPPTF